MLSPTGERAREILHSTGTERKPQDLIGHYHGYITETTQQQESLTVFGIKCSEYFVITGASIVEGLRQGHLSLKKLSVIEIFGGIDQTTQVLDISVSVPPKTR